MKFFAIFACLFVVASAETCYQDAVAKCGEERSKGSVMSSMVHCNARYGGIDHSINGLQKFVNANLKRSFQFLILSTHFGNYDKNRHGFEKLYRKLSDTTWDDAIDVMKFIGKRGKIHSFSQHSNIESNEATLRNKKNSTAKGEFELYELESLSKALDIQKDLAAESIEIHKNAIRMHDHDNHIAHYIDEKFSEKYADCIRDLSGHIHDLSKMLDSNDATLAMYMFDEYLHKKV